MNFVYKLSMSRTILWPFGQFYRNIVYEICDRWRTHEEGKKIEDELLL